MRLITWLKKQGFDVDEDIIKPADLECSSIINEAYLASVRYWVYEQNNDCEPILVLHLKCHIDKIWTVGKVFTDSEYNHGDQLKENEIKTILKKYIK
ncbi:hypothetical protein [Xenorhabdus bovienii]|uniref:hypothetical protein n=1 Tax=Xenorhabdus bovienii TaxID=40576 RepID=UPI0023B29C44|nr:hypothetical protein [Xenorhabdus bovienii]MDE9544188.1 hypothetical protein [Xenorhabdus bovienii]